MLRHGDVTILNVREIWVLYTRELRSAFRERTIVINGVLIPLFLYPFLLWGAFTGVSYVQGLGDSFVSRVVVTGLPDDHRRLGGRLGWDERIALEAVDRDTAALNDDVRAGRVDGVLEFVPPSPEGAALDGNLSARLAYDETKDRSVTAQPRLVAAVAQYREDWMAEEATRRGVTTAEWIDFRVEAENEATERDLGAFILGLMLPLFLVIMIAVGCFYPAVDATAGERERGTWETLMATAASRTSIVMAKYLYVATMGCLAGLLNLVAMMASVGAAFGALLEARAGTVTFEIPPAAVPALAIGTLLLALFIAAGMMIPAAFARTFKEGQSMITPFYLLVMMPPLFLQAPGIEFTFGLALIPVVNVLMVFREAIAGDFQWSLIAVTVAVELATIALCLWLARRILQFEDVLVGSYSGSFLKFCRQRGFRGS